jgi:hypothetical protein
MSIDVDRALSSEGSGEASGPCWTSEEKAASIENGRTTSSCSNVANVAKAIGDALEALDVGREDAARELVAAVLAWLEVTTAMTVRAWLRDPPLESR